MIEWPTPMATASDARKDGLDDTNGLEGRRRRLADKPRLAEGRRWGPVENRFLDESGNVHSLPCFHGLPVVTGGGGSEARVASATMRH